jgi:hypothetical protein
LQPIRRSTFASADGVIVVLDTGDELKILATNTLDGGVLATPALVGGNIYVRTVTCTRLESHHHARDNRAEGRCRPE